MDWIELSNELYEVRQMYLTGQITFERMVRLQNEIKKELMEVMQ